MSLQQEIINGLKDEFKFKTLGKEWLQGGKCPDCKQTTVFCAAVDPKVVRCGRSNECRWEDTVRNLLPDLFEDWSKRHPRTEAEPNAAADAYLSHERGLDLMLLRGSYTEELYQDYKTRATGATVRFRIADTYWERIIDRPGRFGKKAHFERGGTYGGHVWMPPVTSIEKLAQADEILITEGIFDATAITQVHRHAVSAMSTSNYPDRFLADLRSECVRAKRHDFPRLVFAFDVGRAGVEATRDYVKRAKRDNWEAEAMQVHPDGEGKKLDWNDLLLRHVNWKGNPEKAPLSDTAFETYRYNGAITIAETAHAKGKLIAARRAEQAKSATFYFRHNNITYWAKVKSDDDDDDGGKKSLSGKVHVEQIANCAFRLLYRERDDIKNETRYFARIDFPEGQSEKATPFSNSAISSVGEFRKTLALHASLYTGTAEQLDRIMLNQLRGLKVVQPIPFTGYSRDHKAWVLGNIAVHKGATHKLNSEDYFDFGKSAVKLLSRKRMLDLYYDPDQLKFDWLPHLWTAWGPKGLVALAFFTMSLFAVQIRDKHKSLGLLEITGEPGAGKSTLIEFLWKLLGRNGYEGFDPNKATPAFLARSFLQVSNLPVGLVEGKRGEDDKTPHIKAFDYNELLVLYNGRSPRGTAQKSNDYETNEPDFLGSVYVMQNERINGIPAVLQRLMSMNIDKSNWSAETKASAVKLEQWPSEEVSGTLIHVVRQEAKWLEFFFERFSYHDEEMPKRKPGLYEARPIKCHSQLAAAVEALAGLFPSKLAQSWIDQTVAFVDAMALDRQTSAGGDHPLVVRFWELIDALLDREKATEKGTGLSINQSRNSKTTMAIRLTDFEIKCRNAGLTLPDMDKLKKVLSSSKNPKFLAQKKVNNPDGKVVACWVFEWKGDEAEGRII
ncbi:toprim domain-containing protein [Novosphingobium rosa]|uniref:toprim domain-containing protein n=1 Tax=Novosphingobium rosa TaxID=76978 RepID=UPI00082C2E21|nr:toprim domain-containing protein [Novosphingobium rosa]